MKLFQKKAPTQKEFLLKEREQFYLCNSFRAGVSNSLPNLLVPVDHTYFGLSAILAEALAAVARSPTTTAEPLLWGEMPGWPTGQG